PLTVTGITGNNKVYDGTPVITANTGGAVLSGVASGDTVNLSTIPTTLLSGFHVVGDIIFDSAGNLYVSDSSDNTVKKFAPGATTPTAVLTGLGAPTYLAIDGADNLYVANNNAVCKFTPGSLTPSATLTGLSGITRLACDAAGNVFVSDSVHNTI